MAPSTPRSRSLLLGVVALVGVVAGCGGTHHHAGATTTAAPAGEATCPLTGLPAPGGKVPQRPALAVKIDNLVAARPPSGVDTADVVYEQPVEGGITRFIAIFQCRDAARIEPVRSVRFMDPDIIRQFGDHPLFGYSGGAPPVVANLHNSPLIDVGASRVPQAYTRDPQRQAPHNLFSSTALLYAAGAAQHASTTPPAAVFRYGPLGEHRAATAVGIAYGASHVTWTWQAKPGDWLRSYSSGPASLAGGGRITTTNVVIMRVSFNGTTAVLTGSGAAEVFRNGAVIDGRWQRPALTDTTNLVDAAGRTITLAPGQTWVQLVPTNVAVNVS